MFEVALSVFEIVLSIPRWVAFAASAPRMFALALLLALAVAAFSGGEAPQEHPGSAGYVVPQEHPLGDAFYNALIWMLADYCQYAARTDCTTWPARVAVERVPTGCGQNALGKQDFYFCLQANGY